MRRRNRLVVRVFALAGAMLGVPLLAVEAAVRIYFALQVGPSLLLYGFEADPRDALRGMHALRLAEVEQEIERERPQQTALVVEETGAGYAKYRPHQVRYTHAHATGETVRVGINARGFRGPDVPTGKPPGTIRIAALGASSTFGIYARDHETWPRQLEQILNRRCPADVRYEVVNLGIPHTTSQQNLALFRTEALPLEPDVVTFYEGINDTTDLSAIRAHRARSGGRALGGWPALREAYARLQSVSLAAAFVAYLTEPGLRATPEEIERHQRESSERFLANLSEIARECEARGIAFVVANQQAQSNAVPRESLHGVRYAQEARALRRSLEKRGFVETAWQVYFLTHVRLMRDLETWARERGIPFVDAIAALDGDRDVLLSWVHLSPEGNRMLAEAFADAILPLTCR